MTTTEVRPATRADLDDAADTLAEAFAAYPWMRFVVPDEDYDRRVRELQRLYLSYALEHGIVVVTPARDGVIALLPPDAPEPPPEMIARVTELHGERIDRLVASDRSASAWGIETLGVRTGSQGRGIASALIGCALAEAARRGAVEVALETSDARNIRLYQRHGFAVVSSDDVADGPPVWRMRAVLAPPANPAERDDSSLPIASPIERA